MSAIDQIFGDLLQQVPALFRGTVQALLRENKVSLAADFRTETIQVGSITVEIDSRVMQGDPLLLVVVGKVKGARPRGVPSYFVTGGPILTNADDEYDSAIFWLRGEIASHETRGRLRDG